MHAIIASPIGYACTLTLGFGVIHATREHSEKVNRILTGLALALCLLLVMSLGVASGSDIGDVYGELAVWGAI